MNSSTKLQMNQRMETELKPVFIIDIEPQKRKLNIASFDQVFLETLDIAFSSLGETCKQAIYHQLEKRYAIRKEAIPRNVKEFTQAVEDLFGETVLILEIKIMRILHDKVPDFRISPEKGELSFVSYLENLRSYL